MVNTPFTKETKQACRIKLLQTFPGSFFNKQDEFIMHPYSNTYFIFSNCESELDVACKILEWCSRPATKGIPYKYQKRNDRFHKQLQDQINCFLETSFSEEEFEEIYQYLGNCINHKKSIQFVLSGYDFKTLTESEKYK